MRAPPPACGRGPGGGSPLSASGPQMESDSPPPTPSRAREGEQDSVGQSLPLPPAGGDRGEGPRSPQAILQADSDGPPPAPSRRREGNAPFRRGRATVRARELRRERNEIEERLWARLRRRQLGGFKFVTQMPVSGFHPDFLCRELRLVVELDGSQHAVNSAYDERRTRVLERNGHTVLRFWNSDILGNMEGVLQTILAECERLAETAPPPACGRGQEGGSALSSDPNANGERRPSPDPSRTREGSEEA